MPRRRVNRRAVAIGVGALGLGGALLWGTPLAQADDINSTNASTMTFDGNCGVAGLIAPSSAPDKSSLEVDGNSPKVTFVNDLGAKAVLYVGSTTYDVSKDGEKTVTLSPEKSYEVAMKPSCLVEGGLLADIDEATVSVTEEDVVDDSGDDSNNGGSNGDGSSGNDDNSGDAADGSDSTKNPPADGADPKIDPDDPAAKDAVPPAGGEDAEADGTQPDGTIPGTTDPNGGSANGSSSQFAVEPVDSDAMGSTGTGLLALIATVCLVGVGAAAVRTVATQRVAR